MAGKGIGGWPRGCQRGARSVWLRRRQPASRGSATGEQPHCEAWNHALAPHGRPCGAPLHGWLPWRLTAAGAAAPVAQPVPVAHSARRALRGPRARVCHLLPAAVPGGGDLPRRQRLSTPRSPASTAGCATTRSEALQKRTRASVSSARALRRSPPRACRRGGASTARWRSPRSPSCCASTRCATTSRSSLDSYVDEPLSRRRLADPGHDARPGWHLRHGRGVAGGDRARPRGAGVSGHGASGSSAPASPHTTPPTGACCASFGLESSAADADYFSQDAAAARRAPTSARRIATRCCASCRPPAMPPRPPTASCTISWRRPSSG